MPLHSRMAEPLDMEDLTERIDAHHALDALRPSNPYRSFKVLEKAFARGAERLCYLAMEWSSERKLYVSAHAHF